MTWRGPASVIALAGLVVSCSAASSGNGSSASTTRAPTTTTATSTTGTPSSAGTSSAPPPSASGTVGSATATQVPHFSHIVVVWEENHGFKNIVGSGQAPYINSLIRSGVLLTAAYAETHPSEPNYVAMFSGSQQGLTSDACPNSWSGPDLASALVARGRTFTGYAEGLPHVGDQVCNAGDYARRHCPWTDFTDAPASASRPFADFPSDYSALPSVAFVVPNLEHDMHNGTIAQGDTWLHQKLAGYVTWARTHNSLLIVTYDESELNEDNRVPTVLAGAHLRAGTTDAQHVDHYSLLRTIEDAFGTAHVGTSARRAPLTTAWR